MPIFPCRDLASQLLAQTKSEAESFLRAHGRKPCLAVVLAGNDPASEVYVRKKGETCATHGIDHRDHRLAPSEGFAALEKLVDQLNADSKVDGILVQSPLPKGWDERAIFARISPKKDVDGFHPQNAGALLIDARSALASGLPPCTPAGVMEVLRAAGVSLAGKHAVVVGRSTIVGKPMALMLQSEDATVTMCHSRTKNLAEECRRADVLIAAVGKPHLIGRDHVKPGAVVIDVGINRLEMSGKTKLVGDVNTDEIKDVASLVTPVPNGIGPMTIAMLLRNTVRAAGILRS